jgi:hypothetical protein
MIKQVLIVFLTIFKGSRQWQKYLNGPKTLQEMNLGENGVRPCKKPFGYGIS